MYPLTFMAVSSWPDSMLTVRLILTSHVDSGDILTDLYGCVSLARFHANCEATLTSHLYFSDVLTGLYGCVQLAGFLANYEPDPDLTDLQ